MAFTSHADAAFDVCFENLLTGGCMKTKQCYDWGISMLIGTFLQHNPGKLYAMLNWISILEPMRKTGQLYRQQRS